MKNTNTTKIYSQSKLIDRTLKALNKDKPKKEKLNRDLVLQIISSYESVIVSLLKQAAPDTNITVKPFHGIRIESAFNPSRIINMYGKETNTEEKISVKAKLSKYFGWHLINNRSMGNS